MAGTIYIQASHLCEIHMVVGLYLFSAVMRHLHPRTWTQAVAGHDEERNNNRQKGNLENHKNLFHQIGKSKR